jgi:hypothetical protein
MEWSPGLKPYDLLPKSLGGVADVPKADIEAAKQAAKQATATATAPTDSDSDWNVSFHDLLDVVNPLQHFPVVGTIYRALTHDQIKTPEKIIGDTLYGGVMGLASSVADVAFEKITGHNFGDTVLALFTGHYSDDKPTAVANTDKPGTSTSAAPIQTASLDEAALTASLNRSGADSEMTQRALYAYRRTTGAPAQAAASPF